MDKYKIMKRLIALGCLISLNHAYAQPNLPEAEKDSVRTLVCNMEHADQDVRSRWEKAKQAGDSGAMKLIGAEWRVTDSTNFVLLDRIIRDIGYPCTQLLGKELKSDCMPNAVLVHWIKNHPAWFCDRTLIPIFKREIELGHLPLPVVDFCFFAYVSYMNADLKLLPMINEARTAYGLVAYTKKQYTRQEYMEPLMRDSDEDRRKHKMRLKQTPQRNSEHS
jgi:hypothetical protein